MKFFSAIAAMLILCAQGRAQVQVEVVPSQGQFLPGESLEVAVRVSNSSGEALALGDEADWLKLTVESREGLVVSRLGDVPVQGGFTLESSKVAVKHLDIAPYFNFSHPGRYLISATVNVKAWDKNFSSGSASFDIIRGSRLWEQEFGVPDKAGGAPEVRKFALQQANYLKQPKLYFRISDGSDSRALAVKPLGSMVSFSEPQPQLDRMNRLHVLWQTGARSFAYRIVSPDGEIIGRRTYDYIGGRPKLRMNEDGQVEVAGGQRHPGSDDLPANETPAPASAATP